MVVRKLLLLTYHFPPSAASGSFRLLGFARHLPCFGWTPVVVAPPTLPWEPVDGDLARKIPPDTCVCPVPYPAGRLTWPIRRVARFAVWLAPALRAANRAIRRFRPEAVLTSGPPHCVHLLGLVLKHRHRLPWAADFRDPWITTNPPRRLSLRQRLELLGEGRVISSADVVIANAPRAGKCFSAAYPASANKVVVIPNGYDAEEFASIRPAIRGQGPLRILHAGEIYAGRDPRPLLDALVAVRAAVSSTPLEVRFLGLTHGLAEAVRARGLEGLVSLQGQLPYTQTLREMAEADVLLLLDSPGRRLGVPAKLYEYLGARRTVLALAEPDGDVAWVLRESKVPCFLAPPTDTERIREALLSIVAMHRTGRLYFPAADQSPRFTREEMSHQLATILDRLVRLHQGDRQLRPV